MSTNNSNATNIYLLTNCRDGGDDFSQLQLVKDGRLSGGVKTDHENPHFLLTEEALENTGKGSHPYIIVDWNEIFGERGVREVLKRDLGKEILGWPMEWES